MQNSNNPQGKKIDEVLEFGQLEKKPQLTDKAIEDAKKKYDYKVATIGTDKIIKK